MNKPTDEELGELAYSLNWIEKNLGRANHAFCRFENRINENDLFELSQAVSDIEYDAQEAMKIIRRLEDEKG